MPKFSRLAVPLSTPPMEARLVPELPTGAEWQFEPKWDGFRCLAFRDGGAVELMSKSGKPLGRYFPEVVATVLSMPDARLVLDGELVLPRGETLSFADLQLRLHPSASRIARLARETPAQLMVFDCLQRGSEMLVTQPLAKRRALLEDLARQGLPPQMRLSPATDDPATAREWLARSEGALDGIVAKQREQPYRPGERAMVKYKMRRTADCVIGGYRTDKAGTALASCCSACSMTRSGSIMWGSSPDWMAASVPPCWNACDRSPHRRHSTGMPQAGRAAGAASAAPPGVRSGPNW